MSVTKTTHTIDKIKKLIDLNGDSINFEIAFKITSQNNEPFDVLVVDQTTLDSNSNLEYKRVTGSISGSLVHDKNVYQNYYLILKSDQPCQCTVEISKKDLPRTTQPPPVSQTDSPNNRLASGNSNWAKIMFFVLLVSAGALVLYWLSKRSKKMESEAVGEKPAPLLQLSPPPPVPSAPQNTVLSRLKQLRI